MTKDDQSHAFTLGHAEKFPRTGAQLFLVVIDRPGLAVRGEQTLHHHCVNGQQHGAGLRQGHWWS